MEISTLRMKKYRNYDNIEIKFNKNLNIIIGNNAQGKTNILEAIYYLSITKSFLSVKDKVIINNNSIASLINCDVINKEGITKLSIIINTDGKKLFIDNEEIKKHIDFIGNFRTIIFCPDDIGLLKNGPVDRRKFLNIEIGQLYNEYLNKLSYFNLILKQRNEYLKYIKLFNNKNMDYLDIINEKYSSLACEVIKYRYNFISQLNKYISNIYDEISGYNGLYLKYLSCVNEDELSIMKSNFLSKLNNNFDKEVNYGGSLYGPHRDDFGFFLNESDLDMYGSQGQKKMAVLALKLSEIDVFIQITGESPVLLLDDLFSELDIEKRNKLLDYLNNGIQSIITTTDIKNINNEYLNNASIFIIENGKIKST